MAKRRKQDPLLDLEASLRDGASGSAQDAPPATVDFATNTSAKASPSSTEEAVTAKQNRATKKRKKKEAKKKQFVLYDPQKMKGFAFSQAIGYFLRFFSIGFSLFGVLWLFCDAFALTDVSALPLLGYCVAMVSAFSMIFIGKWFTLAGFGIVGAWVGLFFLAAGNPLTFYVSGVESVFNAMMFRLTEAGFAASSSISLPYFGGLSGGFGLSQAELLSYGGIFALATVFALVFAAFSAKRTRLLPMLILGGGLCAICFTYNLCETNWGIACVLAGLSSAAVLSAYDKTYKAHKHSKKSRAYSGYSAALAGILALAIAALPAASVKERWNEIEFISGPIQDARMLLTTILTGGNPKYNKMNTLNERTSNKLKAVEFEDVVLFRISSPAKHPVYLRSWIGGDYDYATDDWAVLDSAGYRQMLNTLSGESASFMGDQVTFDHYSLLAPSLSDGTFLERGYQNNLQQGYAAAFVDIEYINNSGQLFVLPSAYASPLGIYAMGSRTDPYDESVSIHADGMYASSWFNLKKSYSAAAVLPSYYTAGYARQADLQADYYRLLCDFIGELRRNPPSVQSAEQTLEAFRIRLNDAGLADFTTEALEYYLSLNRDARDRWYTRYIRLIGQYSDYVKASYLSYPTESEGIRQVLAQISDEMEAADTTHEQILTVMQYLSNNYQYTYTPTQPQNPDSSALDAFLLETKDGYCVQFASAATLLLRAAGIPARYVQGYVADELSPKVSANGKLEYIANVRDTAAHAWVEVYIEGLGWRTYEATSVYYDDLYYVEAGQTRPPQVTTTPPVTSDPVTSKPAESARPTPEETTAEEGPTVATDFDMGQLMRIGIGLVTVAAIAALVLWQYRRARRIVEGRAYFIERSSYGTFEEKADFDKVAGVLCDSILEIHAILGNRPRLGELSCEFARRIDAPPPADAPASVRRRHARLAFLPSTLEEIAALIGKHEFGRALTRADLETLGVYLDALIASEYRHLPIYKRIWYRYIRFMI